MHSIPVVARRLRRLKHALLRRLREIADQEQPALFREWQRPKRPFSPICTAPVGYVHNMQFDSKQPSAI
jgi:hypothetical protein